MLCGQRFLAGEALKTTKLAGLSIALCASPLVAQEVAGTGYSAVTPATATPATDTSAIHGSENEEIVDQPVSAEEDLFSDQPVAEGELAAVTGREASTAMAASSKNSAVLVGNHVGDNSTTGNVEVTDNAFGNIQGISMINMNTGNASSINSALNINLQVNYAAPDQ